MAFLREKATGNALRKTLLWDLRIKNKIKKVFSARKRPENACAKLLWDSEVYIKKNFSQGESDHKIHCAMSKINSPLGP